jgi:hypothetical protein
MTHSYLLEREGPPQCIPYQTEPKVEHALWRCLVWTAIHVILLSQVYQTADKLFHLVSLIFSKKFDKSRIAEYNQQVLLLSCIVRFNIHTINKIAFSSLRFQAVGFINNSTSIFTVCILIIRVNSTTTASGH